jgi:hypothetical protein
LVNNKFFKGGKSKLDAVLDRLLTAIFWLAIAIVIGLLIYHWLPNATQTWIQTQVNAIFNFGTNLINNATGT